MKSKEKEFPISEYPLLQTEFLYESKKGTADIKLCNSFSESSSLGKIYLV